MLYMIYRPKHTVTSAPKLFLVFMTEPLLFFNHKASNLFYITYFIIFGLIFSWSLTAILKLLPVFNLIQSKSEE